MKFVLVTIFALLSTQAFAHSAPVEHVHIGEFITIAAPAAAVLALLLIVATLMMSWRSAQATKLQPQKVQRSERAK